jgi:hypothetical protein
VAMRSVAREPHALAMVCPMILDPAFREALSALAETRSRCWSHWEVSPWTRDEDLERRLAGAWAAVVTRRHGELVVPVAGAPQCSVGAPTPVMVSATAQTSVA